MTRNIKKIVAITVMAMMILSCVFNGTVAYASTTSLPVAANVYDLDKNSHYVIGEASPSSSTAAGILTIDGAARESEEHEHFSAYEVTDGNVAFTYSLNSSVKNRSEYEWHIIEDKTKEVNGLKLDSNILSGAIVLQL